MKKAWIVSALLLSAACSDQGGTTRAGQEGSAEPASPSATSEGELLYESDFSSPEGGLFGGESEFRADLPKGGYAAGEYTPDGTLSLTSNLPPRQGVFLPTIANTGGVFAGERELVDMTDVRVRVEAAPGRYEGNPYYGIHCRVQDVTGETEGEFYEASIGLGGDGQWGAYLFRIDPGQPAIELAKAQLPSGVTVAEGQWNVMTLDCIGDQLTFSIDGNTVAEATDDTYASGAVAVFAAATVPSDLPQKEQPGAFANAQFDNLEITEL